MKTLKEIETAFKTAKISAHFNYLSNSVNKLSDGKTYKTLYFHKYTHADKAIVLLEGLGFEIKPLFGEKRGVNILNAYFKYSVTFNINALELA